MGIETGRGKRKPWFIAAPLLLLCHKRWTAAPLLFRRAQQGQRGRLLARAMAVRSRMSTLDLAIVRLKRDGFGA